MNGLGWEPRRLQINLTAGDWFLELTNSDGALPSGTVIEIEWATGQTWPALIEGDTVSWRVESETVALIPGGTAFTIWVRYPNTATSTTDDFVWIVGTCRYIK